MDLEMLAKELGRNHSAMYKDLASKLKCSRVRIKAAWS
jgi:hypothetical protein